MSQVLSTFRSSIDVAVDAPMHAVLVLLVTLVTFVVGVALGLIPIVGPMVSSILVTPLMLAAVLGSANAARLGEPPFTGLKRGVGDAGTSLVGAFGLLYAGYAAVGIVLSIVAVVVFALTIGVGSSVEPTAGSLFGGAMGIVFVLLFLVVLAAVVLVGLVAQFVGPAAVVAGTGAVDSLRTSYRFFRQNVLGVLGFTGVVFLFVLLAYVVAAAAFAVGYVAISDLAGFAMGGVAYVVAFALVGAVLTVYQVTYFDAVADESVLPVENDRESTEAGPEENGESDGSESPVENGTTFEFADESDDPDDAR